MEKFEVKILMKEAFREILPGINFEEIDLSLPLKEHIGIDALALQRVIKRTATKTGVKVFDPLAPEFRNLNEIIHFISGQPGQHLHHAPTP